ncbi:glycosyltransferase [Anthocerotibacter panamensis]|uniref:glycosyltransferase n=1 Tax=Anthocerotibacter panamensis TaxID=2857077 RepID=UPI001C408152|nr:glycosyltransferase family 2 protein [Anthocerotibacter panamensis]
MDIWASLSLSATACYWLLLEWADQRRAGQEPQLNPKGYQEKGRVSVVIPARNEVTTLPRCLDALLKQRYLPEEIIVVDDNSTDGTGDLLAKYQRQNQRIRPVQGAPLPVGWTGKCYALSQGVALATGDWILFVDADTCLEPDGLEAALHFSTHSRIDLLSLTARQEAVTLGEQAVQPMIYALLNRQYPLGKGGIAANGQFILVAREAYETIGTHQAVAGELVEDVALARLFHRQGYHTAFINGTQLFSTRMYRDLAGLWEGWSKNSFRLFAPQWLDTVLQLAVRSVPWLICVGSLLWGGGWLALAWGLVLALGLVVDGRIRARQAFDPKTVWLQFPGALLTALILVNSWLRVALKLKTAWKGRLYAPQSR